MKILFTFILFLFTLNLRAQALYFPPLTGNTWDAVSPTSLGWCPDKIDTLLDYLESRNTKAFIVLKDGKIAIERYFGTFTMDSVWYWASAGKTLTAFTVGIAQQEGHLSINDLTSQHLGTPWTDCPPAKENMITIRNQLTMTSGLDDGVPDNSCTIDTCLQYLADAGTRWAYHNAPYTLLDSVIFYSTGQTLNSYLAQKIKVPTGITGGYLPSGYDNVFFSKPRSMARYGLLVLNKGNWNGNQIMTDTAYFNQMVNTSQALNLSYGYLWWLNGKSSFRIPTLQTVFPGSLNPSAPSDMFAALGKYGQIINVVPSMNLVYIRMGNSPGSGGAVSVSFNDTIWQKLNDVFCNANPVSEMYNPAQLSVFPNPVQEAFTINLPRSLYDLAVYDVTGRLLMEKKNNSGRLVVNCSDLMNGIYFIEASDGKSIFHEKIILER